jgi:uncharacterized protein YndB with AHSA1/START domain
MTAYFKASTVIDRPLATVFHFFAEEHVRNHPRWDPHIELWKISEGPMGVGTMIRRWNSRRGAPVEGTMEVVEYEPDHVIGMLIHDGPVEIRGRTELEAEGDDRTRITHNLEFPGMDDSMDKSFMTGEFERSLRNIKQFIESET